MSDFNPPEWAARKAAVAAALNGTTYEIIVAALERIATLEREVAALKPTTPPPAKRPTPLWGGRPVRDDAAYVQDGEDSPAET